MSARGRDFVRRWVQDHAQMIPAGARLSALAIGGLVVACESAAERAEISLAEIEEDGDDLVDLMFAA